MHPCPSLSTFPSTDSFRKIIVRNDIGRRGFDESGVLNIALTDFLLETMLMRKRKGGFWYNYGYRD